ncbi:vitamin K epoxide reductase family protein, partial [bacterium]|nr:vitamin K epoxide reductase family protein [bacterium]
MDNMVKKKLWVGILAFIGFLTTVKLAFIYYDANFNPYALSSFCSINEFIDCDGVAQTRESQFFGIPLALWGLILYSFIFLMLGADKLKNIKLFKFMEVFKNPLDYIASLGFVSFIISVTLLCVSLFEIKKLCILCALTYILNLL